MSDFTIRVSGATLDGATTEHVRDKRLSIFPYLNGVRMQDVACMECDTLHTIPWEVNYFRCYMTQARVERLREFHNKKG